MPLYYAVRYGWTAVAAELIAKVDKDKIDDVVSGCACSPYFGSPMPNRDGVCARARAMHHGWVGVLACPVVVCRCRQAEYGAMPCGGKALDS